MTWEPCVTCARLRKCSEVNHALLLVGGGCSLHEVVHEGVVCARLRIMDEFGARAIPTKSNLKKGIISMAANQKAVANKRYLRALAKTLGVIPDDLPNGAFRIPAEDLCDMILTTEDERFANIYEMTDDEVKALKEEVKNGGTSAPKAAEKAEEAAEEETAEKKPARKTRTRRTRKKKEEAPVEEEPAASDEDTSDEDTAPPKKRAPSKRKAPAGRRRPGRKAPAKAESETAAASADLSKLEDMVKTIGVAGDDRDKAIKSLGKMLEALAEKIDAIDGYLCYDYNQEQDEGNEIGSLTEVDWT